MIELEELRSQNSKHFLIDITPEEKLIMRAVIGGGVAHYKDDNGKWQDVNMSLSEVAPAPFTHMFSKGVFRFLINDNTGEIRIFPDRKSDSKYIAIGSVGGGAVDVRLINKHLVKVTKDTPNVTYNFFLSDSGLKINHILKNDKAPNVFNLRFELNGGLTQQGREIHDGDKVVGILPNPFSYDSATEPVYRDMAETIGNDVATLTADLSGLTFPVTIDPILTIQPSTADARIRENAADTNYGSLVWIDCVARTGAADRSLLSFDFSSLSTDANITAATLSLYRYSEFGDPTGRTYWTYRCTRTNWTEGGVTWNQYDLTNNWTTAGGDYTSTDGASSTVPANLNWQDWDVLAQVQYAQSNTSEIAHFLVKDGTETEGTTIATYYYSKDESTETSLRPKLVIDYDNEMSLSESTTLTDALSVLINITKTEAISLSDTIALIRAITFSESLSFSDAMTFLATKLLSETLSLSDAITTFGYKPNVPLESYKTRMLVDMFLDSGTVNFSSDDIYITE